MEVDRTAALVAKKEILIKATPTAVWGVQSDINKWPEWQKDISYAQLDGPLRAGTIFRWKAMGMKIESRLEEVVRDQTIGWTGKSIGMYTRHVWRFKKKGDMTRVTTEESLSEWFPRVLKIFQPDFLENSLEKALFKLKNRVEEL